VLIRPDGLRVIHVHVYQSLTDLLSGLEESGLVAGSELVRCWSWLAREPRRR
jgi:hypothetical protein